MNNKRKPLLICLDHKIIYNVSHNQSDANANLFSSYRCKSKLFQNTNFISVMRRSQQIAKTNDRAQKFLIAIKNTLFSITN